MKDPERKAKAISLRDRLLSLGAGVASLLPSGIATTLLGAGLAKGVTTSGPTISSDEAANYSKKVFGKDQPVMIGPGRSSYSSKYISLPEEPGQRVRLPLAAHEAGHAHGGLIQGISKTVGNLLFATPTIGKVPIPIAVSPLHIPLALAATSPVGKDDNAVLAWIKKNPAVIAGAASAIPLIGEGHASLRGLWAINKSHGLMAAAKSAVPMARGFGTHALSHVPAVAGLWLASKVRDLLQRRREAKAAEVAGTPVIEKKAGMIGRVTDRPLLGTFRLPGRDTDEPMMNTPSILIRPRGRASRAKEPDRADISQGSVSGVLGVQ